MSEPSPTRPLRRREFLQQFAVLAATVPLCTRAVAQQQPRINPPALLDNDPGNFRILPAGGVFCGGVLPNDGYEVVHALLDPWPALADGYTFIERYLKGIGRPVQALCGMELRVPKQMTFDEFRTFNAPYVEQLRKWELVFGPYSGVCRTNVAPGVDPPERPSIHAFSYVAPAAGGAKTFCVSGTADITPQGKIVAEGDTSAAAMREKIDYCFGVIGGRLAELDLGWSDTTHIDLYFSEKVQDLWGAVSRHLGKTLRGGVRLYHARPPIVGAEVELEARGVRQELVLATA